MSKIIKITQQAIDEIVEDFRKAIQGSKLSDGKVTFSKTIGTVDRKATLYFSELAYLKMLTLVREFDKEVAWHGLAYRGDDPEKDEYIIKDILVYPQEVTGATVTTDQEKYQTWLMNHEDDVFNNIRMQGHSHVNMGVTPSSVDTSLYERILDQLEDDMFYIFLIWNKKNDKTIKIYDLAKNVLFETADVSVKMLDGGLGLDEFMAGAKEMVKTNTYTTKTTWSGYAGGALTNSKKDEKNSQATKQDKSVVSDKFDTTTKRTPMKYRNPYYDRDDDWYGGGFYASYGGRYWD